MTLNPLFSIIVPTFNRPEILTRMLEYLERQDMDVEYEVIVVDGTTGFLVENRNPDKIAEKIEFFLDNRSEIGRMGKADREHVEKNFTWDKHVTQLLEIYQKIITNKN